MLLGLVAGDAALVWLLVSSIPRHTPIPIVIAALGIAVVTLLMAGLFMVNPNEGQVLQLFGKYAGTAKMQGLRWANPFLAKKKSERLIPFDFAPERVDAAANHRLHKHIATQAYQTT